MSAPVTLACLWCIAANLIGLLPSKHKHWPSAYVLIAFGLPLLVWVYLHDGWITGVIFTLAGASILRWPLRYLIRRLTGPGAAG